MKRRHLFRTELKYDFGNRRFYISVLALCAVLLIVALPYRNHLIAFGGSTEGKAWLCIFTYAITSEKALLFFPLLVPLATAADIQEELHSRYAWFLINRIGKRNYIWMKSLSGFWARVIKNGSYPFPPRQYRNFSIGFLTGI